jgi:2-oxoglutarate dehydrogenase E2 component (dihydrolipoamide succinyltransferase)
VPTGRTVPIGTVIGIIEEAGAIVAAPTCMDSPVVPPAQGSLFDVAAPLAPNPPLATAESAPLIVPARPFAPQLPPSASPAARKQARARGLDLDGLTGSGPSGQVLVHDVAGLGAQGSGLRAHPPAGTEIVPSVHSEESAAYSASPPNFEPRTSNLDPAGRESRTPLSPIRKRIAERLVAVRQQTAMLTTFNEADLSQVKALRAKYREPFKKKYGIDLGYMGFFVRACVVALQEFPMVNARIDGSDIVHHHYCDIGIAIGADKGLVVPVLRGAETMRLADVEQQIADFVARIRENRLAIADLAGGTFTITNGGVYGSLLSTPILNPPQSAVLGMHAIQDRPVVRDGQIVIRPMMYLALSYDHRLIDGREAVQFLKRVKEAVESPQELLAEG